MSAEVKQARDLIERDEALDRTYIPLSGGWEIQTKGKGSTFRICDPSGNRSPVLDDHLHDPLERMGREILGEVEDLHIENARLRREALKELAEADQLRARITQLETAFDRCIDALADARSARSGGLFPDDIAERDAYRAILERKA